MTSTSIYQDLPLSYVYRLDHPTTGEFYFGFRKANSVPANQDLGIYYFTSSKYVKPRFDEFNHTIIQEFVDPLEAYDLEQFLIFQERKNPSMLNRNCHYGSKSRFTTAGKKHTAEQNAAKSASTKGVPKPDGFGAKISARQKGVSRGKGISRNKGVPKSEEHKSKQSASTKGVPKKPQSEETKAKRSAALTGIPRSEETKSKLRVPKPEFFSIIKTRKTYNIQGLSRYYPEFKQYF